MSVKKIILILVVIALLFGVFLSFNKYVPSLNTFLGGDGEGRVVLLKNNSNYIISPGVLVVHGARNPVDLIGDRAPAVYERLAEVGEPAAVIEHLEGGDGVYKVIPVDVLEVGGEHLVSLPSNLPKDARVSYMAMIVQTNDGVVWLDAFPLISSLERENRPRSSWTHILDAGFEENAPIASGFENGQVDPARGEENINNGTEKLEKVTYHTQFYDDPEVSTSTVLVTIGRSVAEVQGTTNSY